MQAGKLSVQGTRTGWKISKSGLDDIVDVGGSDTDGTAQLVGLVLSLPRSPQSSKSTARRSASRIQPPSHTSDRTEIFTYDIIRRSTNSMREKTEESALGYLELKGADRH